MVRIKNSAYYDAMENCAIKTAGKPVDYGHFRNLNRMILAQAVIDYIGWQSTRTDLKMANLSAIQFFKAGNPDFLEICGHAEISPYTMLKIIKNLKCRH